MYQNLTAFDFERRKTMKMKEVQQVTTCIKHLAVSGLSSISARIKSSGNLTGNRFVMPNVSYTQPLGASVREESSSIMKQDLRNDLEYKK